VPGAQAISDSGPAQPITWGEFAELEPDLARFGANLLTAAPAYLATIRRSGAPRVHPVTPIFTASGLFLFMEPTSPKRWDLIDRRRFAMHNGVPDNAGTGGEFSVSGEGQALDDPNLWSRVADAAGYTPEDRYMLFELLPGAARCHGYGDVPLPSTTSWVAGE
jgi:hypothetical protein